MLLLKTRWGNYILQNALRLDVFAEKGKQNWRVYICIDSYKHILHEFESHQDASIFSSIVLGHLRDCLSDSTEILYCELLLSDVCTESMEAVELESNSL